MQIYYTPGSKKIVPCNVKEPSQFAGKAYKHILTIPSFTDSNI